MRLRFVPRPSVSPTVLAPAPRCEHLRTHASQTAIRLSVRARVVHSYAPLSACVYRITNDGTINCRPARSVLLRPGGQGLVSDSGYGRFCLLILCLWFSCCVCALILLPLALVVHTYVCGVVFLLCLRLVLGWKRSIGEWCCGRSAFVNLVVYAPVGWLCRILRRLPPSLLSNLPRHRHQRDLHDCTHDKVYSVLNTDTMTSALSDTFPPGKTLETATRTALAEQEELYQNLNDRKLTQKRKLDDTRLSIDWLGSARGAAQVILDSTADVVSVLSSFVNNLSSVISIHESDQIFGDLEQSLPSVDAAKRSWESVADVVGNLLVQIESLKSATLSHAECMARELVAHESIEQQSQIFVDSLTQSIDVLTHSITRTRAILHPIRRVPTEILKQIFELATLEERLTLQRNLDFELRPCSKIEYVSRTVPRIPTILASTCRGWRTIALDMPLLWSFLRVPTMEQYMSTLFLQPRRCVIGLSAFQLAKSCIGVSKCEVVVILTADSSMTIDHLRSIPSSQISTLNIVIRSGSLNLSQIPTVTVLRIFGRDNLGTGETAGLPSYCLPSSVLANTRELDCHYALPVVNEPILSVTSFSLSFKNNTYFPDLGLPLANFPNLRAVVLSANVDSLRPQNAFTPLRHTGIITLSITDTVIPHLCASLQQGALSLPSLTHFILLDIFPSNNNNREEWRQLQSLFINVTRFEIRAATQQGCGSNIRQLLDVIPLLQQFTLSGNAVNDGLQALLIAPIKRIGKLVISDSETDGWNVKSYHDALRSESANRPDDNWDISIQFVCCPYILPQIREQVSS